MIRAVVGRPFTVIAVAVLLGLVGAALSAPLWAAAPNEVHVAARLSPPSAAHVFGTDNLGRDLLSRVTYGAQTSLAIGASVTFVSTVLGTVCGLAAGYYPRVDAWLMRFVDGLMAFPALLLALAIVSALGANALDETLALTIVFAPRTARIVRATTLALRGRPFVEAAIAIGANDALILRKYILRNAAGPLIVQATFVYAEALLADAALSFLGLGVKEPAPTWGNILGDARTYLINAPWFSTCAGIAIVLSVAALNILGETLRDLLDPHARRRLP